MNVPDKQQGQGRSACFVENDERMQAAVSEGTEPAEQGKGCAETVEPQEGRTLKERLEWHLSLMSKASGFKAEEILSGCRYRPLPAVRWMICRELLRYGYPNTSVARALNISRATLLYGLKMLKVMRRSSSNWRLEIEIEERYRELINDNNDDNENKEPGPARP